ncbi:unnamed protein product [Strongylus vulgaris]|uniref:Uncharacterized protein n=1 Tax=Strongylus vulgaris TaxID=40348 RepID=A0A3P7JND3_STRVU|nr:unnamed protein product [Strongylus vulgaris]
MSYNYCGFVKSVDTIEGFHTLRIVGAMWRKKKTTCGFPGCRTYDMIVGAMWRKKKTTGGFPGCRSYDKVHYNVIWWTLQKHIIPEVFIQFIEESVLSPLPFIALWKRSQRWPPGKMEEPSKFTGIEVQHNEDIWKWKVTHQKVYIDNEPIKKTSMIKYLGARMPYEGEFRMRCRSGQTQPG